MNKHAIFHLTDTPFAYADGENTLAIRLRAARGDLKKCEVFYKDRYDWGTPFLIKEMKIKASTSLYDFFEVKISIPTKKYRYFFKLIDTNGEVLYYNEKSFSIEQPKEPAAFQFAYIAKPDVFREVNWAHEGIVYSIFPERFCNGDLSNDPEGTLSWGEPVTQKAMFGGDIKGIIDKLPYLSDLGISIIYLTPFFLSISNHKYDIDDYYEVDPQFGNLDLIKKLVSECHKRHIRVLFDAVYNHCSCDFFAFKDVLKNGEKSQYKDWFFIDSFPVDMKKVNYRTFGENISYMPKLNTANETLADYLLKLTEYWMRETDIDGWRLDVCDEVSHMFWKRFRKTVKKLNPDALIVGEVMHEASAFLRGDELDSTMNYPLREVALDFFASRITSVTKFEDLLVENRMLYMDAINLNMFNLLDSHDTERFLTMCKDKKERLKCAITFQFCYIGIPYIYYGDEVGIDGGYDPLCRRCMIWDRDKQDTNLLDLYRKLCHIRNDNKCLAYGDYVSLSSPEILAFRRNYNGESILVLINNQDTASAIKNEKIRGSYINLLTGEKVELYNELAMKANEYLILKSCL